MKRRLLLRLVLLLGLAVAGFTVVVWLLSRGEPLVRHGQPGVSRVEPRVNEETFQQLKLGMSEAQVVKLLKVPGLVPHCCVNKKIKVIHELAPPFGHSLPPPMFGEIPGMKEWTRGGDGIVATFDEHGILRWAMYFSILD
jgi:hypothetical protein